MRPLLPIALVLSAVSTLPSTLCAQGTAADYDRAAKLNTRFENLAVNVAETPEWIGQTTRFWYRKSVQGGNQFVLVDAATRAKGPAFDHVRMAAALSGLTKTGYTAITLPFTRIDFVDNDAAIQVTFGGGVYQCPLADYACKRTGDAVGGGRGGRGGGAGGGITDASANENDPEAEPNEGPSPEADLFSAAIETMQQQAGRGGGPVRSPDGKLEAYVLNFNIYVRPTGAAPAAVPDPAAAGRGARGNGAGGPGRGGRGAAVPSLAAASTAGTPMAGVALSDDGSEKRPYLANSIAWSPDSKKLVAYRVVPGDQRYIHYVLSSPAGQLQPRDTTGALYLKPGDAVDKHEPMLFDIASHTHLVIDSTLFQGAYNLSRTMRWRADSRAFTFDFNQRGHQVYRVIEVDAASGKPRALINEETKSFFYYNAPLAVLTDGGKHYEYDLKDGREILWMSERDGWNHLYLYDGVTGQVKNQITKGPWVVKFVERVDTVARQIWFTGLGMNARQDPYLAQHYRINFDGTGLAALTDADGSHTITWSPDRQYYIDSWSRVDLAPVSQVRRASDLSVVMDLERGDLTALEKAGWSVPEVFSAKGRDGTTDIWGVIYRPTNFNAKKKYPVIENIYAGPQGSFVPKTFTVNNGMRNLAELGFIVVQIDGMGTSNRSKAFHDVAWKNLGDAGFPDRVLWHRAVAARYPSYDITRVGIYGTSAGGQNALGGLLFHPEFYKVGFSAAGCHDNRMDKIWWNEQWMGYPIGPEYVSSSNTEHAAQLQGKLMLVVGEYDTNVDPSSTIQVVNALIKANKTFDFLYIPNADHGSGGAYGERKRNDFFVHNLLGVEAPDRNALPTSIAGRAGGSGR